MAIVRFLGIPDPLHEFVVGVALSLALGSALASFMVYTGTWSPRGALYFLSALSVVGALLQLLRDHWCQNYGEGML